MKWLVGFMLLFASSQAFATPREGLWGTDTCKSYKVLLDALHKEPALRTDVDTLLIGFMAHEECPALKHEELESEKCTEQIQWNYDANCT